MNITFLGTGTSQGVPVITCDCEVCTSDDERDNRLRSSVLIEVGGYTLVIDTGPDFRQQMLRNHIRKLDAILFTHKHKDHVAGMDDVRAFNFRYRKAMPIYGDRLTLEALKREFPYVFDGTNYPGVPQVVVQEIDDEHPFEVFGIPIVPIPVLHHRMPVLGFRIGPFAYVTDANYIPPQSFERLAGVEVLVLNALRHEKHISHFTVSEALEIVDRLQPRQTYFTHISHLLGRHAEENARLPEGVALAYDGLQVRIDDALTAQSTSHNSEGTAGLTS